MTKYILVGGYPWKTGDGGKSFCEELISGFKEPVKVLECLFARDRDDWEKSIEDDKVFFAKNLPGRKIELIMALPEDFTEQVRAVNVVYLRGGETKKLMDELARHPEWSKNIDGKTVAGTSAGACIIGKYYHELVSGDLGEGLGFLPVKTLAHYRSDFGGGNLDWDIFEKELENYKEKLPMYKLREGEFVVIKNPPPSLLRQGFGGQFGHPL